MNTDEREELEELRREMHLNSLGDRPHGMPALKLRRLIQLEAQDRIKAFCWVCRSYHGLVAAKCPSTRVKVSQSPSYTLAEMRDLMLQWIHEQQGETDMLQWSFSIFLEWLAKREKEVGDGA